jgi:hypothetical protein
VRHAIRVGLASLLSAGALIASVHTFNAATRPAAPPGTVEVTEVIAVYVGSIGTDSLTGMAQVLSDMGTALRRQTASSGRGLIVRGVSIEPSVEGGIRHLSRLGAFDEVSVGGNWTNSAVVRYLGANDGRVSDSPIPELILLERTVRSDNTRMLQVGPEREIARFVGLDKINGWVARGAPLPK